MVDLSYIQTYIDNFQRVPLSGYPIALIKRIMISVLKTGPLPSHIGLIMDGNRRYAKSKGLKLEDGHSAGAHSLAGILETCYRLNVTEITIYAFSIENFNRPKEEVDTLLGLLRDNIKHLQSFDDSYVHKYKVRVKIIGNKSLIPEDILADLTTVEERTTLPNYERILNICFPYTSRDDITNAVKGVSRSIECHKICKEEVCEKTLSDHMYMGADTIPLDLLIRTSGHSRLSDFMLWQCTANCKVKFIDTLWPNFKFLSLYGILLQWSFQKQTEENENKRVDEQAVVLKHVDLSALPRPPPFACVGQIS